MTAGTGPTSQPKPKTTWGTIKAILAASSGNLVEWFDFYIYSFFSVYFAEQFFVKGDQLASLTQAASVFFVGFLMRPIGGYLFGRIADRVGRKNSMVVSILLMCFGSLCMAFLPTKDAIGAWAAVLLLLVRMVQGLAVGGEYGATATYMSEVATEGKRGFFSSFQYVTLVGAAAGQPPRRDHDPHSGRRQDHRRLVAPPVRHRCHRCRGLTVAAFRAGGDHLGEGPQA
jgi:MHS family alpha-ketoglutarate permease-like MFS transporter